MHTYVLLFLTQILLLQGVFDENEAAAEDIQDALLGCIFELLRDGNSVGMLKIIQCIRKANGNDKWLVSGCSKLLPMLYPIVVDVLSAVHVLSNDQQQRKSFDHDLEISECCTKEDCIKISALLFELSVDYCDVVSKSSSMYLSCLAELACEILLENYKGATVFKNLELSYAMDCLYRNASFSLCNIAESFPENIIKLYATMKKSRLEIIRLMSEAPEASIQRSLTRVASLLYSHRSRGKFSFPEFRSSVSTHLRKAFKETKNSEHIIRLFQQIDVFHDDSVNLVEHYRETAALFLENNVCFTTTGCRVVVVDVESEVESCFDGSSVDWDEKSFALRFAEGDPSRVPWYQVRLAQWSKAGKELTFQAFHVKRKILKVCFDSSAYIQGSMAYRVCCRLQERISFASSHDIDLEHNLCKRKISQAFACPVLSPCQEQKTVFSELLRDGTLLEKQPYIDENKVEPDLENVEHPWTHEIGKSDSNCVLESGSIDEELQTIGSVENAMIHKDDKVTAIHSEPVSFVARKKTRLQNDYIQRRRCDSQEEFENRNDCKVKEPLFSPESHMKTAKTCNIGMSQAENCNVQGASSSDDSPISFKLIGTRHDNENLASNNTSKEHDTAGAEDEHAFPTGISTHAVLNTQSPRIPHAKNTALNVAHLSTLQKAESSDMVASQNLVGLGEFLGLKTVHQAIKDTTASRHIRVSNIEKISLSPILSTDPNPISLLDDEGKEIIRKLGKLVENTIKVRFLGACFELLTS